MKRQQKKLTLAKSIILVGGHPTTNVIDCPTRGNCTETCYNC